MDTNVDTRPVMQWIEVPDGRGGTRLEARWAVPADLVVTAQITAQVAAA